MLRISLWFIVFLGMVHPLWAQEVYQAHTHVQLVSEQDAVEVGKIFWAGVDLRLDDGWHVYWQNPGDAGLAPKIKWSVPSGIKAGDIHWPYPQRLKAGPLMNFGYEHEVLLLVPVSIADTFSSANARLHARFNWLACDKEECVPGRAELDLPLPLAAGVSSIKFNGWKHAFDQTRQNLPQELFSVSSRAVLDGDQWHLDIRTPLKNGADIIFYPFEDDVIEHAAPQYTRQASYGYQVILKKSHIYQGLSTKLAGVAVNPAGWDSDGHTKAVVIRAPIDLAPVHLPFMMACLFALIGGLVLNLMPCVLPVLSIKVLHLIERHPEGKIALRHSLVYALGILVSVWSLALLLFVLKAAGKFAGWGFQFQSPVFVAFVAVVLFVLALNLFGVFEFSLPSIGGIRPPLPDYQASFISGIITTVVASPCTAPFMGAALTVGLSQPNMVGFGIFTFLGLGLASPFILLSAFPFLLSFVPKPGIWMIYLKKAFGLILLVCVAWLLWVFGIQTGLWDLSKLYKSPAEASWHAYSSAAVDQVRESGHGVFIDFTADWCINCQVNDRLVLHNAGVVKAFKEHGIITFKGDWTKYDPAITQALALYGRNSIPVYVFYPPGGATPHILPQLITPKMVIELCTTDSNPN